MPVFSGQFKYAFDTAKGRVSIPAHFRNQLQETLEEGSTSQDALFFHITYGKEPCLYVFPRSEFKKMVARLQEIGDPLLGVEDAQKTQTFRRVMASAQPVRCDQQGRFVVPKSHIDYAGIEDEVLIVGMGNRIEIWNPKTFEQYI